MKINILILLFVFGFSVRAQQTNSNFLHVEGTKIVDHEGKDVILRGMGLGGYMLQEGYMLKVPFSGQQYVLRDSIQSIIGTDKTEAFYKAWLSNFIQKTDIDSLKSWGFNSVRLPMHYNLYTLPVEEEPVAGENTWLEKGFTMTDSLVNWCKTNDMYLILDMHAAPGGQGHDVNISDRDPSKPSLWESEANQEKLVALWKKLAEKYKGETTIGAYDLINEPNWSFDGLTEGVEKNGVADSKNEPLKKLMVEITRAIREVDQNHIIIIEGNGWGNNYNGILPQWDDNMVLSFHKYWNYNTQEQIQKYIEYREKYNIPIWMGESGENSNAWFTDAISLFEKNNIGWCWWPLKKLGSNNPLEIKVNAGYQDILDYWKGESEKPSESEGYDALLQLAENTKIENCIVRYDVIDAMIRQPHTDETLPYKIVEIPSEEIQAVNYDMGNNDHAYKDSTAANYWVSDSGKREKGNIGGEYRNDGVDIYKTENNFYVGNTQSGEWLQYTFQAEKEGTYQMSFKISSEENKGKASIEINDEAVGTLEIPDTSKEWKWILSEDVLLKEGKNVLKFKIENGGFNLEAVRFQP